MLVGDIPGYSSSSRSDTSNSGDDTGGGMIIQGDDVSTSEDTKSFSLCEKMETLLVEARNDDVCNSGAKVNKSKVTSADLNNHNLELVTGQESNRYALEQYIQGIFSKENSLWNCLHHFATEWTQ